MAKRNFFVGIFLWFVIILFTYCSGICVDCEQQDDNNQIDTTSNVVIPINDTIINVIIEPPVIEPPVVEKPLRTKLIETFRSQIGVRQVGNNTGPEVDMYLAAVGLGPGNAWCGAFAGWGYLEHNLKIPTGAAWTPNWFTQARIIKNEEGLIGDVGGIYFQSLGRIAHIVVFDEDWDNGKNLITTIEGNTNDTGGRDGHSVLRKYRSKNQIYRTANWINV